MPALAAPVGGLGSQVPPAELRTHPAAMVLKAAITGSGVSTPRHGEGALQTYLSTVANSQRWNLFLNRKASRMLDESRLNL